MLGTHRPGVTIALQALECPAARNMDPPYCLTKECYPEAVD
jgi:hypothetical protein